MNLSQLFIGSANPGKQEEFGKAFQAFKHTKLILPPNDLAEPEEDGKTFADNAYLKAKYYGDFKRIPALADDSGLEVFALEGAPGIESGRWLRSFDQSQDAFGALADKLQGKDHGAQFVCHLCLYDPLTQQAVTAEGILKGTLSFPARGEHGFGYDPLFVPEGYTQTLAEMGPTIKSRISHRHQAMMQLLLRLNQASS
ncbi:non-canonical purine NTP pyrophosphatase [Alphaproteobacteria bacterium]|nr:non-canonical purine NTP pyrophosphatase [Alphaproteobacteria bacterium]